MNTLRNRIAALAAGAFTLTLAVLAFAQVPSLFIASPTGTEQIEVVPPATGIVVTSPLKAQVTINQVRNSTGHLLVPTGTTVTSAPANTVGDLVATGAITTWNVSLPNPAFDGELFAVTNGTGSTFTTNVSVTAPVTPQVQVLAQSYTSQSLTAGATAQWIYDFATLTWYRVR